MKGLLDFLKRIPKVELHIHLEGSIPCAVTDNKNFFKKYTEAAKCLKTPADLVGAIRYIYEDRFKQNILYTEYYYQSNFHIRDMPLLVQLNALNDAIEEEHTKYLAKGKDIIVRIIIDFPRTQTFPMPHATKKYIRDIIKWQKEKRSRMIVGFGLGGRFETCRGAINRNPKQWNKNRCEPLTYKDIFAEARKTGYKIIPHAGETSGWKTVVDTIQYLRPHRIGHGIRMMENPKLVENIVKSGLVVDVCPTSNLMTLDFYLKEGKTSKEHYDAICEQKELNYKYDEKGEVMEGFDEKYPYLGKIDHPVKKMLDAGIKITINSDDPAVFGTDLTQELILCMKKYNFSLKDIYKVLRNAIDGICDVDYKEYLREELDDFIKTY